MKAKYKITRIHIHHFRSIADLTIDLPNNGEPTVICGPNNVGKTNILRALNLFFYENFTAEDDVPYHIVEGSRGQGFKSAIEVTFWNEKMQTRWTIKKDFTRQKNIINVKKTGGKHVLRKSKSKLTPTEIDNFLKDFWYIFVEASNVNLPKIVIDVVKTDVLSAGLDHLRKKQKIPLDILQDFVTASGDALKSIEKEIGKYFQEFIKKNDLIKGIKEWNIEIIFPEFDNLREAISDMVSFTLYDTNRKKLDFKGSGIQRLLFLSLVRYISSNTRKNIVWGIDEPEVFLQPGLQKEVYKILRDLAKELTIILTTHSHHFINLNDLNSCLLLDASYEIKKYQRRPGEEYFKVDTRLNPAVDYEKIAAIKQHMGIQASDSWEIVPFNILVEGEEDKEYLVTLFRFNKLTPPNVFVAGGADKIKGYLSFLNDFAQGLSYTPKVLCILDHDQKGREVYNVLNSRYTCIALDKKYISRFDGNGGIGYDYEIEDFIYPEVLIKSVNDILTQKSYDCLTTNETIQKKSQRAYIKMSVLRFINNEVTALNATKDPIDFESVPIKKWLCKIVCRNMKQEKSDELNRNYPAVFSYLKEILINNL